MSDENNPRAAEIKIIKEGATTFYQVRIKFLDHIAATVRWDDSKEEGRSDVCALLRDYPAIVKNAFMEIEIDNASSGIDVELAELYGYFGHQDIIFTPDESCLCSRVSGLHPDCPLHGEAVGMHQPIEDGEEEDDA